MIAKYKNREYSNNILYTVITVILICAVFFMMVNFFYLKAEDEAYEMLHIQTKQIKDNITLQLNSDRENLVTMSHFASRLYESGESYDLLFESFEPIGLFSNIGILNPDNTFVTKRGNIDLSGKISFDEEAAKGEYISDRVSDLTVDNLQIIRSAVPVVSGGRTVGMLYGVIKLDTINEKYSKMANELDAQLFVYDKETGKFVIDTINSEPGELSQLEKRQYNDGYSYEDFINSDSGFSSFKSIFTGEDLYLHYSTLDDFNWGIMLGRYESQVFARTHNISMVLLLTFCSMALVIALYLFAILKSERRRANVNIRASGIRKLLLEVNQQSGNFKKALKDMQEFCRSRSAFFVDSSGESYLYTMPSQKKTAMSENDKKHLISELFRYGASRENNDGFAVRIVRIITDKHFKMAEPQLFSFLRQNNIREVTYAIITDKNNHVSILGVVNPSGSTVARILIADISICFSIAVYNKNHLSRTELAATTDSLTGVQNRVSYKKDIVLFDEEKPRDFSCIYIDVNELHLRNNKYGHAAGDEMLIYIANTLKDVFFGQHIYRMGGDEFLVFTENISQEQIKQDIDVFVEQIKVKEYNVAIGLSYRSQNTNCEEMVKEAEVRMYEAKAHYYQNKNKDQMYVSKDNKVEFKQMKTGISEIDTMISVLRENYNGIYRVDLATDTARRILMPSYLGYNEEENNFSKLLTKYIDEYVHPEFHRPVMTFLNYDAIRRHLAEGEIPSITFKKVNGETVVLSVYNLDHDKQNIENTLWFFAKK